MRNKNVTLNFFLFSLFSKRVLRIIWEKDRSFSTQTLQYCCEFDMIVFHLDICHFKLVWAYFLLKSKTVFCKCGLLPWKKNRFVLQAYNVFSRFEINNYIRWVRWKKASDWSIPVFLPWRISVYSTTVGYNNFTTMPYQSYVEAISRLVCPSYITHSTC